MLMKTPLLAIGCVLIASVLGAIAPFFFEHGAKQLQGRISDFVLNPWIVAGMATSVRQHFTTTPLILEAETYEAGGEAAGVASRLISQSWCSSLTRSSLAVRCASSIRFMRQHSSGPR